MIDFMKRGIKLRGQSKTIALDYLHFHAECQPGNDGIRQAHLFRDCGFDWDNDKNAYIIIA